MAFSVLSVCWHSPVLTSASMRSQQDRETLCALGRTSESSHRLPHCYGVTRNFTLLVSVRWGVTTFTLPVVAPAGTVVVISELETT